MALNKLSLRFFTYVQPAVDSFSCVAATITTGRLERAMYRAFLCFLKDDSGATAIEYGLIAAGIAVAIIVTVQALGSSLNTTFTSVSTALK
jgi:pilus assembly protein Flp/PilA